MKSRIDTHNRNVVRKYNYNSDIAAMWIRSKDFLKSKNGGDSKPYKTNNIYNGTHKMPPYLVFSCSYKNIFF